MKEKERRKIKGKEWKVELKEKSYLLHNIFIHKQIYEFIVNCLTTIYNYATILYPDKRKIKDSIRSHSMELKLLNSVSNPRTF